MSIDDIKNKGGGIDVHIKLWQLIVSAICMISIFVTGWININLQVKELQVNQLHNYKKIELNTKKFDNLQQQQLYNQQQLMNEIFEIKLILKDKENKNDR